MGLWFRVLSTGHRVEVIWFRVKSSEAYNLGFTYDGLWLNVPIKMA